MISSWMYGQGSVDGHWSTSPGGNCVKNPQLSVTNTPGSQRPNKQHAMCLRLVRLLRRAFSAIAACALLTFFIQYFTNLDSTLDSLEPVRPIPSAASPGASSHRHLFHIQDIHSSLLDRFRVVDISAVRKQKGTQSQHNFNCTITKSVPSFTICVYEAERDRFISAGLLSTGVWEPYLTRAFQLALSRFPDSTVVDIGANVGYYSLLASAMGHKVIAVEPQEHNILRFVAGACADLWHDNIILLANALSDRQNNVSLTSNPDNQGGIRVLDTCGQSGWIFGKVPDENLKGIQQKCGVPTLTFDDLLHVISTRSAIVKVDIEGYECRALATAAQFFSAIHVPYLFMEWRQMRERQHLLGTACRTAQIRDLVSFLTDRGYQAHEIRTGIQLNPYGAPHWMVGDVYWRAEGQPLLFPSL